MCGDLDGNYTAESILLRDKRGQLLYPPTPPPLGHWCQACMVGIWGRDGREKNVTLRHLQARRPKKATGGNCSQWCLQPGKGRRLRVWTRHEEHLLEEEKVPKKKGF